MSAPPPMTDADWEWPEENEQRSTYYVPSRIQTSEQPAPAPQPKLLRKAAGAGAGAPAAATRVVSVTDYAFADEGAHVKVYVPVPGVIADTVAVDFRDDQIELRACSPSATYVLSLRRLYDRIHTPHCSFKVQTRHDRVLLVLCKLPPQKHASAPLTWPRLNWAGSSDEAPPEPDHRGLSGAVG